MKSPSSIATELDVFGCTPESIANDIRRGIELMGDEFTVSDLNWVIHLRDRVSNTVGLLTEVVAELQDIHDKLSRGETS